MEEIRKLNEKKVEPDKEEGTGWVFTFTVVEEVKRNYKYLETRVSGVKEVKIDGDELIFTSDKAFYDDDEDPKTYFDLSKVVKLKVKKDWWVFR